MTRRRVIVHGHVQGVFFRDSVRRLADERGVAGFATNREDGAVEALVDFCRRGPSQARVERVEEDEEEPEGLQGFRVA